jgi:hypothetical protein
MICKSPSKRHSRPYVIKSRERRETLGGDVRITHECISEISTRLPALRADRVEANHFTPKRCEPQRGD